MKKGLIRGPFPFAGIDWITILDVKWPVMYGAFEIHGQVDIF